MPVTRSTCDRSRFLLFFLSIFLSDFFYNRGHRWWSDLKYLLPIVGPLLLIVRLSDMKITYDAIGWLALISAIITIAVAFSQHFYYAKVLNIPNWRSAALSGNPLFVSGMLVPVLFVAWLGFERRGRGGQFLTALIFVVGAITTAVALGARSSFLTILLMTPFLIFFLLNRSSLPRARKALIVLTGTVIFVGIALLIPLANAQFMERLTSLLAGLKTFDVSTMTDPSVTSRAQHWQAGWQAFWNRPWSGYGFRKDAAAVARYLPQGALVLPTIHQQYLSFGITAGLLSFLTGVAYLALLITNALVASASGRNTPRLYASLALAVPITLNGFTDTIFDDMRIQGFYSVMIVVLLCARAEQGSPK